MVLGTSLQRPAGPSAPLCAVALVFALSVSAAAQRPDTLPSATQRPPIQQPGRDGTGSPPPGSGGVSPSAPPASASPTPAPTPKPRAKRIFGMIPNYRTTGLGIPFQSITAKQKFAIAAKDSFDWPIIPMTAAGAGLYQLEDSHPSFGEGLKGYGKRFAAAYADQAIGNFMTEGVWPSLLRDDPRYFRRGTGSKVSRAWYAATVSLLPAGTTATGVSTTPKLSEAP